jgi:hypothetical protein
MVEKTGEKLNRRLGIRDWDLAFFWTCLIITCQFLAVSLPSNARKDEMVVGENP